MDVCLDFAEICGGDCELYEVCFELGGARGFPFLLVLWGVIQFRIRINGEVT